VKALRFAVLPLLAAGCVELTPQDTEVTAWEAQLIPGLSRPDLAGQVAAAVQAGGTDAGIGITGAAPGDVHTWGLWAGTCTATGNLIGLGEDYPTLAVSDSGKATAETHLGPRLSADSSYHAELRESATDTTRIACGNLQKR